MMRLRPAILCAALATCVTPPANAQTVDPALAPFAYLNHACLIDPTEPDFTQRQSNCSAQRVEWRAQGEQNLTEVSPSTRAALIRELDRMFLRQDKTARRAARRNEALTPAYASYIRCLGKAMLATEIVRAEVDLYPQKIQDACVSLRNAVFEARETKEEKRAWKYLRLAETGGWSRQFGMGWWSAPPPSSAPGGGW